uniref:Uncharacterized protein n=1 Tax=Rhizophora mucronata TaxID=61149 RepID=A0A2P2KTV5_RHIMU
MTLQLNRLKNNLHHFVIVRNFCRHQSEDREKPTSNANKKWYSRSPRY